MGVAVLNDGQAHCWAHPSSNPSGKPKDLLQKLILTCDFRIQLIEGQRRSCCPNFKCVFHNYLLFVININKKKAAQSAIASNVSKLCHVFLQYLPM